MLLAAARVLLVAYCRVAWSTAHAQTSLQTQLQVSPDTLRHTGPPPVLPPPPQEEPAGTDEPHLFELLDAPPPPPSSRPGRGRGRGRGRQGRRGRRIDYYYYYPKDMSLSRTKQQSVELLQQAMYKAQERLRDLAKVIAPYVTHMAFRMAILDGKIEALRSDLIAIWSMAENNEVTITYSMERLVYLYAHELRKYLDLTYIVEFLLLLHHQNIKYVYRVQADVQRANEAGTNRSNAAP